MVIKNKKEDYKKDRFNVFVEKLYALIEEQKYDETTEEQSIEETKQNIAQLEILNKVLDIINEIIENEK